MMPTSLDTTHSRPYAHLTDEEVLLRYLLVWSMKQNIPTFKKSLEPAGKEQHVTVAESLLTIMDKLSGKSKALDQLMGTLFKRTAMRVFFGGETLEETMSRCDQLLSRGTGVIVDYAAPENENITSADHYSRAVPDTYRKTIDACANLRAKYPDKNVAVAVKISTLAHYEELKTLNHELLNPTERGADYDTRYRALEERFEAIARHAQDQGIRAYVDAELTEINHLSVSSVTQPPTKTFPWS